MKTRTLVLTISAALLGFAACTEREIEDVVDLSEKISSEALQTASSSEIMYCGQSDSLWVGTTDPIEYVLYKVTSADNPNATSYVNSRGIRVYMEKTNDFTLKQKGNYLVSSIIPEEAEGVYVATIRKEGTEDYYPVTIPIRTKAVYDASGETPTNTYEARNLRAASVLCHPLAYNETPSVNEGVVWLDKYAIAKGASIDNSNSSNSAISPIVSNTQNVVTWNYETSGSSVTEIKKSWCVDNGVSGKIPFLSDLLLLNIGGSYKRTKKQSSSEEREWYRMTTLTLAMTATMDRTSLSMTPTYYLSEGLNRALNSHDPAVEKLYPLNEEGTYKILDEYGIYLCTTGAFGTYCQYDYSRQANVSTTSVESDAKASLGVACYPPGSATMASAIVYYTKLAHNINSATWSANITSSFSGSETDYHRAVKSDASTIAYGGNCLTTTNYSEWKPTENPDNWNLVSYSVNYGEDLTERELVNILDMVEDHTSARYEQLYDALYDDAGNFLSDECPYAKYLAKKLPADSSKNKTVVADVYMMKVSGGVDSKTDNNVLHERPKSIIMKDPNGKEHLYHPFIINPNGGDFVSALTKKNNKLNNMEGYGFIMGSNDGDDRFYCNFMTWDSNNYKNNAMILYYALDDWKYCNALEDVFFGSAYNQDATFYDGYIKRCESSMKEIYQNGDRCPTSALFAKYVSDANNSKYDYPRITALALVAALENSVTVCTHWETGYPFASTLGTEWLVSDRSVSDFYWKPEKPNKDDKDYNDYPDGKKYLYITVPNYNANRLDKVAVGDNTEQYYITNLEEGFGPRKDAWPMKYSKQGQTQLVNPKYTPSLTYRFGNNHSKDDYTFATFMLEYTTRELHPDHMTAPRAAKTWPYDPSK